MKFATGDETGLVKIYHMEKKLLQRFGEQSRKRSVLSLKWCGAAEDIESVLGLATKQRTIEFWIPRTEEESFATDPYSADICEFFVQRADSRRIVTVLVDGTVVLQKWGYNEHISELKIPSPVDCAALGNGCPWLAFGGKNNIAKIADLETKKVFFKAKNLGVDEIRMQRPIWTRRIEFLNCDASSPSATFLTSTGHGQVRLYDTRAQRRCVRQLELSETPLVSMALDPQKETAVVGNTTGQMWRVDLGTFKSLGIFKGITGTVKSISCHPTMNVVACASLDRWVRVFDLSTRKVRPIPCASLTLSSPSLSFT